MNPRNKDGFALSDGEVCERLWRRFSCMTKEMRPSHRIDILTDALLHFARLTVVSLSKGLLVTYQDHLILVYHCDVQGICFLKD